ncbi:MAG: stage 0 sporulation family protein [Eubacteriales bacterium]|nr:stage 0 sporulation family protein [Eubacteriales bacterium]
MAAIVGVRFKNAGKLYYFDPGKLWPAAGDYVIVETARGLEYGQVITGVRQVEDELIASPLKQVTRICNEDDARHARENEKFEKEAYGVCQHKIEEHKLDMKLVGVEQTFDNTKILFYFTANGRVDFRSLVKDLASVFHTRIELRQIGVRDEAKMLGGLGPCGRPICCGSFLGDFQPVSIKMAKEQNLSLNPTKISGVCGRLMCCLKFEQDHYEATRKRMPKLGKEVETPDGFGSVADLNVLKETVTVRVSKGDSYEYKAFPLEEIKWARPQQPAPDRTHDARIQDGKGPKRTRVNRPSISSDTEASPETDDELPLAQEAPEDPMEPVEQDNDWRKAVEDALNAAEKK